MIEELLKVALKCNISFFDFWNMTIGEVNTVIDCYVEKMNNDILQQNHLTYNLAYLTARFVNSSLAGKPIPSYGEIFEPEKSEGNNSWIYYKEKLLDYQEEWNKRIEKQGGK